MKKWAFPIFSGICAGLVLGTLLREAINARPAIAAEAKRMRVNELVIEDADGNSAITMTATKDVRGIWLHGFQKNQMAFLYSTPTQHVVISVADSEAKNWKGHQFAISIDKDGCPSIQVVGADGKVKRIDTAALLKLAKE